MQSPASSFEMLGLGNESVWRDPYGPKLRPQPEALSELQLAVTTNPPVI